MIPLIKSTFYREGETKKALIQFLRKAKILSFGKECEAFEQEFSRWQERYHAILVNSGSSANLAVIQALLNLGKIKKGDQVGFSAVTWSTNVMPLLQLGLVPVPIDVSLETLNISPVLFENVTKKYNLKMLFLTNLLGFCDEIDGIEQICKRKKIILIEDNCESLGSIYKGRRLGNYSYASTFSFYVGHHMSTVEGGMITTDDEKLATMLRIVRAHGWDRNLDFFHQEEIRKKFNVNSTFYSRYTFYDLGYNLRPTEITGFLGRNQLQYLPEIVQKRQKNFSLLANTIYGHDAYYPFRWSHMECVSNFAVPLICRDITVRDTLVRTCEGVVEIRPIVGGDITAQPFFKKYIKRFGDTCPNARLIHQQGLYFGNNPELTKKELALLQTIFNI